MSIRTLHLTVLVVAAWASSAPAHEPTANDAQIARLIQDLGADSYATRTRAKDKLQRLGLEAFDDLHGAQFHPDNEIAMAARFLVSSLMVSWSKESDPPEVHEALSEYGAQDEVERASRIDMLAELTERKGLVALARLARFETSLRLSRLAALAAMRQPIDGEPELRQRNAGQILQTLGDSQRQAASWLRVYAQDLESGAYSSDSWRDLIASQRQEVDAAATDASSRKSILELVRVCATRAADTGRSQEAIALATEHIDLIPPTTRDLIEACSWAIDHDLHPFVLELQRERSHMFDQHPILLYGAAEAYRQAGDQANADHLAEQASRVRPLPTDPETRARLQPKEIEEMAQAHRMIAEKLRDRGLFEWAEREYRLVIDAMDVDAVPSAKAREQLADMLAELLRHEDVVAVLTPLVDRVKRDEKLTQKLNNMLISTRRAQSTLDFHAAKVLLKRNEIDQARRKLMRAFQTHPNNIDILIEMYRTDGDESWQDAVRQMLNTSIRQSELAVKQAEQQAVPFGRLGDEQLAIACNQYAWLVANTEGDYQKALQYSLKSLEFKADPISTSARLDTCARCYFAAGYLDRAIVTQKLALKLMPHSPPLQRQLQEFLAARSIQQETAAERP